MLIRCISHGFILWIAALISLSLLGEEIVDPIKLQQDLQNLAAEISKFRDTLQHAQDERTKLEQALATNEKEISRILRRSVQTQRDLHQGKNKLSALSVRQNKLQQRKATQRNLVSQQIRTAYELGIQPYLKVFLSQKDPHQLSRMLVYYNYFNRARLAQIRDYELTLMRLDNITQAVTEQNRLLTQQRTQLGTQRADLVKVQVQKQVILQTLQREIVHTEGLLEQRMANRARLETLLAHITAAQMGSETDFGAATDARPFTEMRGHLLPPVAGRVHHPFGSRRKDGKLSWNGVFISAVEGTPVHAIHYGQVVFSDWLRGFGLLLIINHGKGFMSLYGHNQVLYKKTGAQVSAGERIAEVGNSGGQQAFGLYFEIRAAGKPTNPEIWCQIRSAKAA